MSSCGLCLYPGDVICARLPPVLNFYSGAPKLQQEKQKRKEKKEKRKEKKEKRKEKKEKRKEKDQKKDEKKQDLDKLDRLKGQTGKKIGSDIKVTFLHKSREAETEQLERSSLTEEHAGPVDLPGPSYSSDSTENSNKRKRNSSTGDGSHGRVILIRLPSKKQSNFDTLAKEQPIQEKDDIGLEGTSKGAHKIVGDLTHRSNPENICSTSGQAEAIAPTQIKPMPNKVLTSRQREELEYTNLLGNLLPPQLRDACLDTDDDLDWLFKGKNEEKTRDAKRHRSGSGGISCSLSSTLWPRAEYLHEVGIYALPYTVPY